MAGIAGMMALLLAAEALGFAPNSAGTSTEAPAVIRVAEGNRVTLDESSDRASLTVGQRFEIRLKAQLGAGFSWSPQRPDVPGLKLLATSVLPSKNGPMVGGVETQVFAYEATAPGEVKLDFAYRRPWMKDSPPDKTMSFLVRIAAP
jgi:inhibitor of cysteine peptidase